MSVLSAASQKQVEEELVSTGVLTAEALTQVKQKAEHEKSPFLSVLIGDGHVTDEQLTKTIAHVNKVPYVNLSTVAIKKEILRLLSKDIAERYMAVPLGEMQHRLVVAMLDADNIQAVDFLSNKTGRPLKVYAASETGIRHALKQYKEDIEKDVSEAMQGQLDSVLAADAVQALQNNGPSQPTTSLHQSSTSEAEQSALTKELHRNF